MTFALQSDSLNWPSVSLVLSLFPGKLLFTLEIPRKVFLLFHLSNGPTLFLAQITPPIDDWDSQFSNYTLFNLIFTAVLTLYFINVLSLSEDDSVTAFHSWTMACYFTPIFGAILADSILGRYSTILYISILYAIGSIVLSVASWLEKR